ncbi:hypothetical protein [Methylomonas sp. LWB]|uniref:hypothetical protein n=1 Tax=Methylomonas sp. LWB TaxID=1905845 RepID=UPI00111537E7|nr:hypothetical protein [Methylomonas sp. LWB]
MTTVPGMPMLSASLNAGLLGAGPEIDLDALDVQQRSPPRQKLNHHQYQGRQAGQNNRRDQIVSGVGVWPAPVLMGKGRQNADYPKKGSWRVLRAVRAEQRRSMDGSQYTHQTGE